MAGSRRGGTLMLVLVLVLLCCSVSSLAAASDVDGLSEGLGSRKLLQATPPVLTPPVPSTPAPVPPPNTVPTPNAAPRLAPGPAPILAPAPAPILPPAPPTPVRVYLMWVGIAAFILVLLSVAVFCLCRKFGQQKVRGAQRLPPLPRYH